MEVKEVYKQTEFGEIPQEWDLKTFGDVITVFSSGATPYRGHPEFYNGTIRWISSGELNYNIITDTKEKITEEAVHRANLKVHPSGTFLIAITGLEAEGTRGRCGFVGLPSTTNQSCMALYPIKGLLDSNYLFHYYLWQGNNLAFKFCQGTKQQSYTANIAKKLPIIVPTFSEQKAIAEVLSETDCVIQSLQKLIAKKRLIKQGAMQQLLKLQAGWETKRLGEIGKCMRGVSYNGDRDLHLHENEQSVRLLRSNNVQQGIIELTDLQFVDNSRVKLSQYINPNDIVVCMANGSKQLVGKAAIFKLSDTLKYTFGAFMGAFRIIAPNVSADYIYHNFLSNKYRSFIDVLLSGSSINNLKPSDIESIEIPYPTIEEQIRIATILNEMDADISALLKNLNKAKQLKQGMMQQLFTGKIRLIKT